MPTPLIETSARAMLDPLSPDAAPRRRSQAAAAHDRSHASSGLTVARTIRVAHNEKLHARSPLARRFRACLPPKSLPLFSLRAVLVPCKIRAADYTCVRAERERAQLLAAPSIEHFVRHEFNSEVEGKYHTLRTNRRYLLAAEEGLDLHPKAIRERIERAKRPSHPGESDWRG
jgi:hypothetical protein